MIEIFETYEILIESGAAGDCPKNVTAGCLTRGYDNYGMRSEAGNVICDGYGEYGYRVSTEGHRHPVCERCPIRGKVTDLTKPLYDSKMRSKIALNNFLNEQK